MSLEFKISDYMPLNLRLSFCNVVYGESSLAYIVVICNDIIKHSSLFFLKEYNLYGNAPCSNSLQFQKSIGMFTLPHKSEFIKRDYSLIQKLNYKYYELEW